jgi:hypothetical protein
VQQQQSQQYAGLWTPERKVDVIAPSGNRTEDPELHDQ